MTDDEQLVHRYFDAFNRHDIEAVMACFHAAPLLVDAEGTRFEGRDAVRRHYEATFSLFPDGRCDLRAVDTGGGGATAESLFHGTLAGDDTVVEALGPEVIKIDDGTIKEISDHHRVVRAEEP